MTERCTSSEQRGWLELRLELWPYCDAEHLAEMRAACSKPDRFVAFVAYDGGERAVGFVEAYGSEMFLCQLGSKGHRSVETLLRKAGIYRFRGRSNAELVDHEAL